MLPGFRLLVENSWLRIGDIVSFVRFVGVVGESPLPRSRLMDNNNFWLAQFLESVRLRLQDRHLYIYLERRQRSFAKGGAVMR